MSTLIFTELDDSPVLIIKEHIVAVTKAVNSARTANAKIEVVSGKFYFVKETFQQIKESME